MLYLSSSPHLDDHHTGQGHPERPARVLAALKGIEEAGLGGELVQLPPREASREELELVHAPHYLRSLEDFCHAGGGHLDADTLAGPGSWPTALRAAGGALAVVGALESSGEGAGFVAHRPPGHHATADQAMGFCLVNTVAVAAAHLVAKGERVLVLDWDVHHGNGTQAIFWDDPSVLYVSVHQWPLYPGTGALGATGGPRAEGLTVNIPLPPGATGDVVLAAFEEVVAPAVGRFGPTWVLISSGFDAHRADPLADLALSAGDYARLAAFALGFAPGPGRVVAVLEGGYDLDAITRSTGAVLSALLGRQYCPEAPTSGGPGLEVVRRLKQARSR